MTDVLDPVEQSPRRRFPHPGRRLLVGAAVLLLVAGIAVAVTEPFGGSSPAASSGLDNGAAVSLYAVRRQSLSSQTQVDGTLGYAGSSTVSVPGRDCAVQHPPSPTDDDDGPADAGNRAGGPDG